MYNKYKILLFTVFFLLFAGFSCFFAWAFHRQQEDYITTQCKDLQEKQNIIAKQIEAMVKRDGDWKKEKDFYKNFLKDSIEEIGQDKYAYAVLYDKDFNLISKKKNNINMWASNPLEFKEVVDNFKQNDKGDGFLYYTKENKNIKDEDKRIYYCFTWIPSLRGNPRYLMAMALMPNQLSYSNYIFTYGAITLLAVYAILFLGYVYVLKIVNLRVTNIKIQNDRRG